MNQPETLAISLWLGPARSGKSAACVDLYAESRPGAWLLVPTANHVTFLKAQSAIRHPGLNTDGIRTFADLIQTMSGHDPDLVVRSAARRRLVAEVFNGHASSEGYFGRMAGAPGFVGALCELFTELKHSEVTPDDLNDAADSAARAMGSGSLLQKTRDVAALFGAYESFLAAQGLQDDDGLALVAAKRVPSLAPAKIPSAVIVDGFFRLSIAWRTLLASLARAGCEVTVTLTFEESRPLLFRTPGRTRDILHSEFRVSERSFDRVENPNQARALLQVERNVFRDNVSTGEGAVTVGDSERPAVEIVDAPNAYAETEAIFRKLRRAHDVDGVEWRDILMLMRAPGEYACTVTALAERFGIPVCRSEPIELTEYPPVKALAALVRLFAHDWQRSDLLSFLRLGLGSCGRLESDRILRLARRRGIREGAEIWRKLWAELDERPARECLTRLFAWYERFQGLIASPSVFASELRAAALELELTVGGSAGVPDSVDRGSLKRAFDVADSVAGIEERVEDRAISFSEWANLVLSAWASATFAPPIDQEAVLVVDAYDARQRDARVTAVMGLTERAFPRRVNEDPFFRDDERAALRAAGLEGLEPHLERTDDERLLFYTAVTSCSERLILSYPRASAEGDHLPSFFLDDVRAALPEVHTIRLSASDVTPDKDSCANDRDERMLALGEMVDRTADEPSSKPWSVRLSELSISLDEAARQLAATAGRPPLPRLEEASLASVYATPRRLSVSELETYNRCPLNHFNDYALRPDSASDGASAGDRGAVYHRAINDAFRRKAKGAALKVTAETLEEILAEIIEKHPTDAAVYRSGLMRRFLEQALRGFAEREAQYAPSFGGRPTYFELAFGMPTNSEEVRAREYDPASISEPLVIRSPDGERTVQLCGAIDRVDILDDAGGAMVIDYKTGSTPKFADVREGKSLQMPIYLMAIETLFGMRGAAACYDSAREPSRRRMFRIELANLKRFGFLPGADRSGEFVKPLNEDEYREALEQAVESVLRAAEGIRSADILPTPGNHCRTCDCRDFCRTSLDSNHDGEPFDLLAEAVSTPGL